MTRTSKISKTEHSIPWFWPMASAIEMEEEDLRLFPDNMRYIAEAAKIEAPPPPARPTPNRVIRNLDTMRLRDVSGADAEKTAVPVLIDAPYAGRSSTIADYTKGQSLVESLLATGLPRVPCADWKPATRAMRDFGSDTYLSTLDRAVDALGGRVALVGLCQGGWLSAMYACLFPEKVLALVLAGSRVDTDTGNGPIKRMAHELPLSFYEEMVAAGGGRMLGQYMLAGWKDMHPDEQYVGKFIDLYANIEDNSYIQRTEEFERWDENPIDLAGRSYLQSIQWLFKENRFAKGEFVGLGQTLSLKTITCPLYLLAGASDDITTKEQVFAAEHLVATPRGHIVKKLMPGGHIGLFMGSRTLKEAWPHIGAWLLANTRAGGAAAAPQKTESAPHD